PDLAGRLDGNPVPPRLRHRGGRCIRDRRAHRPRRRDRAGLPRTLPGRRQRTLLAGFRRGHSRARRDGTVGFTVTARQPSLSWPLLLLPPRRGGRPGWGRAQQVRGSIDVTGRTATRYPARLAPDSAQAVARHPPDAVLVEPERHQLAYRLCVAGEGGRRAHIDVEAFGHLLAGAEQRAAHLRRRARRHRTQAVAVDRDLLDELVARDHLLHRGGRAVPDFADAV